MNYVAIFVAGIIAMVVGFVWYGPLFGNMWMSANGLTKADMEKAKKKGDMGMKYGLMFVSSLVLAYFVDWMVGMRGLMTLNDGVMAGVVVWLGFVATVQFANWLWSGKKFGAFVIDTAYYLVLLAIFGGLFAVWR